jgi:uncharacterized membrane protein
MAAVSAIVEARCVGCHAQRPTWPGFASAPNNVLLDSPDAMRRQALAIHQQSVVTKAMPIGNLTKMTDDERATIDAWFRTLGSR